MQGNLDVYSTKGHHKLTIHEEAHFSEVKSPICPRVWLPGTGQLFLPILPPFNFTQHLLQLHSCFIQYYLKCSLVGNLMELMAHYAFCLLGKTKDSTQMLLFSVTAHTHIQNILLNILIIHNSNNY